MIGDVLTVMWKEVREMLTSPGGRSKWGLLVFVAVFGIFMPIQMGRNWVDSPMSLAYWAWIPLLLINSTIADAFAGERERRTLETLLASRLSDRAILLGKVGSAMLYGCGINWASVVVGLVTVNVVHGHGELLMYSPAVVGGIVGMSILSAALASGGGILISLRASTVRQAQQTLGRIFILLIFIPLIGSQALPAATKMRLLHFLASTDAGLLLAGGVGFLILVDVALLVWAAARFRRAKLILD